MAVDFLLVLGLEHENDLDGDQVVGIISVWLDELHVRIDGQLSGVLQRQ
jgi:hypothetical protein